jgi:outer membrane protein
MPKITIWLMAAWASLPLGAEVRTMTMRQAVEIAVDQNPDLIMARLEEQRAQEAIREARDPFWPRIVAGSGLAYSNGFPMSIEGSAPSVVQAQARQFIFNRGQSLAVAQAKESARSAAFATGASREDVAFRTAELFLNAERSARTVHSVRQQLTGLEKVLETVRTRVNEGRELPIEAKRGELNLARARQRLLTAQTEQEIAERTLATVLGMSAEDRIRAGEEPHMLPDVPDSEPHAVEAAVRSSKEVRRLESALQAKQLEIRSRRAERLPRIDLVAQYGLFARFNHYEDYFRTFQRHNGQLGISIQVPLMAGPGVASRVAQSEIDLTHLRTELKIARNRIELDVHRGFHAVRQAEAARQVARLDLDVTRDQLSILLAQMEEGRASLRQIEEARFAESEKWIAFYDSQAAADRATLDLLRMTGGLLAALQ